MTPNMVRRLLGQPSIGPSGDFDHSVARTSAPISPPAGQSTPAEVELDPDLDPDALRTVNADEITEIVPGPQPSARDLRGAPSVRESNGFRLTRGVLPRVPGLP
ncbi:MAG: hypothetical protein ACREI7_13135 [Myxococcota bacterium]